MQDVYENILEYNRGRKCNVFDDVAADMISDKKSNEVVTELLITGRKLNISAAFIITIIITFYLYHYHYHFRSPTCFKLNRTYIFIMKILSKRELQQIAYNSSSNINYKDFINLQRTCPAKPYCFLVIDTTFAADNPLRDRRNCLQKIYKIIMTTDDKISDEKRKYNVKEEAAKITVL